MSWIPLLWRYRKILGAVLVVVAVAYAVIDYGRDKYDEGRAAVQAKWDADSAARNTEIERIIGEQRANDAATKARNEEIIHVYQEQISRIAADRDSLARRLRDNEVRSRALSEAEYQRGVADAAAQSGGPRNVDEALDAYDRACRSDAAQLEALIRQIRGQLDSAKNAG